MHSQARPLEVGSIHEINHNQFVKILEYKNKSNVLVEYQDSHKKTQWVAKNQIVNKTLKNPWMPVMFDRGFPGKGNFMVKKDGKDTKEYVIWSGMFWRCYDERKLARTPTYKGCFINELWYNFQEFGEWYSNREQATFGWHLDKDLLFKGNKEYGPITCTLLPHEINVAITLKRKNNGLPQGVHFGNKEQKFKSQIHDFNKNQRLLGMFDNPEEAFYAYKQAKEFYVRYLADKWKETLDHNAYEALYGWEVNLTD